MALITRETAAEYQRLSTQARMADKARLAALEEAMRQRPPSKPLRERIESLERQLDKADDLLNECEDAKEFTALVQAKERLLNAWADLTGFPKRGTRKQPRTRSNGTAVDPSPAPQPLVSTPAQPDVQTITPDASDS